MVLHVHDVQDSFEDTGIYQYEETSSAQMMIYCLILYKALKVKGICLLRILIPISDHIRKCRLNRVGPFYYPPDK